jgi:LytS/YehU family sensor histidine kinase
MIVFSVIIYAVKFRIKRLKKELAIKQSTLLLEKELDKSTLLGIKAQMNPHFIFNALNTIQSYIYMNDKRSAGIYISKFSDLTRSILDMSNKEFITLHEEVNALEIYLSLEKMRFEDSFDYSINVSSQLNKESIQIPSMLIQPYVENAIKHGLLHRKNNRILKLFFEKKGNYLEIIVDDNGIGRKQSEEKNKNNQRKHQSFAMEANKKRLDILQQHFSDINLQFIDKQSPLGEAEGTKVIITLPLKMVK